MFSGVSTNGTSNLQVQIGSGSITTSGYVGIAAAYGTSSIVSNYTGAGFYIFDSGLTAATSYHGTMILTNITGNTWVASGTFAEITRVLVSQTQGSLALGGTLDRLRLTTINGTDTFDAGSINILYE